MSPRALCLSPELHRAARDLVTIPCISPQTHSSHGCFAIFFVHFLVILGIIWGVANDGPEDTGGGQQIKNNSIMQLIDDIIRLINSNFNS